MGIGSRILRAILKFFTNQRGKAMGGVVLGFILIIVGFILFGSLLTATDSWSYTSASTTRTVTTSGNTTGDVTLGNPLYDANLDNVAEIDSTLITDDPAPSIYDSDHDILTVSGLTDTGTRALTVTYQTERTDSYVATIAPFLPFFVLAMFLASGGGLMYLSVR